MLDGDGWWTPRSDRFTPGKKTRCRRLGGFQAWSGLLCKTSTPTGIRLRELFMYKQIIYVCSEIYTKHINTLWMQNVEFCTLKWCGKYSHHMFDKIRLFNFLNVVHNHVYDTLLSLIIACFTYHWSVTHLSVDNSLTSVVIYVRRAAILITVRTFVVIFLKAGQTFTFACALQCLIHQPKYLPVCLMGTSTSMEILTSVWT